MNRRLDLNALEQPTLELTLLDEAKTTVHMTFPEVKLIERLQAVAPDLRAVQNSQDVSSINKLYQLAAELISNNEEGLQVTAEDLRGKYRVRFVHLVFIFNDYLDFIREINNEKN